MIAELAQSLFDVLCDLDNQIRLNIANKSDIKNLEKLNDCLTIAKQNLSAFYREIHEPCFERDVNRYLELQDYIYNHEVEWLAYCHERLSNYIEFIGDISNIAYEIELRRPDIASQQNKPTKTKNGLSSTDEHERIILPPELDTERARLYFARAIEVGYMKPTDTGYKWEFGGKRGALARLGYFVERVYCPTNTEQLPEQAINKLFGITRIGSTITQVHNAKTPQKWRAEIDKLFND